MKYNPISTIATYLGLGTAAALAPSVASQSDIGALLGSPAHAQEAKLAANVKTPLPKYDRIEKILEGTPFQVVDIKEYQRIIKKNERVVGFLYDNNTLQNGNGAMATIFRNVLVEGKGAYSNITFLALQATANDADAIKSLGFSGTPNVAFYLQGKNIGISRGGPANPEELVKAESNLRGYLSIFGTRDSSVNK